MTAAHPGASRSPDRTGVCGPGRRAPSQCEMVTGPGFSSPNQPDQERSAIYRTSLGPTCILDALRATLGCYCREPSGDSRVRHMGALTMNIHLWTRTRNQLTITPRWPRWSAWSAKSPLFGIRARSRTRTVTTTWQEKEYHSTCALCSGPEGYIWGLGGFTTRWRNKRSAVVEVQYQYRYFDPPKALPEWECFTAPGIWPQDRIRFENSWLNKVKSVKSYEALLDLEPHDGRKYVRGSDLGVGHHVFEIRAKLTDGSTSNHQLHFDVLGPIEMAFIEPEISVDLNQAFDRGQSTKPFENGRRVKLLIKNNTNQDVSVFLRACSIPRGWHVIVFDGVVSVKAGRSRKVNVQIEMMEQGAVPKDQHLPVAIEGKILGAGR